MSDAEEYYGKAKGRKAKRQKTKHTAASEASPPVRTGLKLKLRLPATKPAFSLASLLRITDDIEEEEISFQDVLDVYLPTWLAERSSKLSLTAELDVFDRAVRAPTCFEILTLAHRCDQSAAARAVYRKLAIAAKDSRRRPAPSSSGPPPIPPTTAPPGADVIDGLYSIRTTPYECTLRSRALGLNTGYSIPKVCFEVDWKTRTPWMEVLSDIRDHYLLRCSDEDNPETEVPAPLIYTPLAREHLPQAQDLLQRTFWIGIDVRDSLDYCPERSTIVVLHKRVVVGVVIMSSPQETYITYLAVRAGWEGCQIATKMLFHLVNLNPHKDIILHVSGNNPAMLLYNRVGFKAEEFVLGFYDEYLSRDARASKNAFRLRLRHH
ncbi:hypothetical protein BD626DRAFT_488628 [Schizophyllum amplum]|uniref:N-acetyltransferase domain-containing protein n=1 Tax=Schizophyllum amplum TaxID=97359 RepID=A0A550CKR3_9AGAR|nr:hypothetical protein BD626DRAFT_488628 [Auriculariopsis ampla]